MLLLFTALAVGAVPLPVPRSVRSEGGRLDLVLTLERATVTTSSGATLKTRAFNGTVPGPTIRLRHGKMACWDYNRRAPILYPICSPQNQWFIRMDGYLAYRMLKYTYLD